MTKKIIKFISALLLIGCGLVLFPNSYQANELSNVAGFVYDIEYPDNQMDKTLGYYKLKVSPNQKQVVQLSVTNPTDTALTIDVGINGAKTNSNGVIEYGENDLKFDQSLVYDFKDIVKGPTSVELGPKESKKIDLTVELPEKEFTGIIAGGITLIKRGQENQTTSGNGSQIINEYAYIVGMVLQESDTPVEPDLSLNSVQAGQHNGRNSINVNYSNITPTYIDNMSVDVNIKEKGQSKVMFNKIQEGMRMAPNTEINYPILLDNKAMKPGKYLADIIIKSKEHEWKWTQEFEISQEEADKYNKKDVTLVQKEPNYNKFLVIGILIILVLLITYVIVRQKKVNTNE